jgi:hypothetical protein
MADTPHDGWTDRAERVAQAARQQACSRGHDHIGPEHYLIVLLDTDEEPGGNLVVRVLESIGVPLRQLRRRLDDALGNTGSPYQHGVTTTPGVRRALEVARVEAHLMGHEHVGTEHLLLGITVEGASLAAQALTELGATPERVREHTHQVLTAYSTAGPPAGTPSYPVTHLPAEVRHLDMTIDRLRRRKREAIGAGDHRTAAAIREEEKRALARRAAVVRTWAPQVDVAQIMREAEHLRAEVRRLRILLTRHGIEDSGGDSPH